MFYATGVYLSLLNYSLLVSKTSIKLTFITISLLSLLYLLSILVRLFFS